MNNLARFLWSIWAIPAFIFLTAFLGSMLCCLAYFKVSINYLDMLPKLWGRAILLCLGCRVKKYGLENLEPGKNYIFSSNHISALDIPLLFAHLPVSIRWVAKKELFSIPILGKSMAFLKNISIDRSNRRAAMQALEAAAKQIQEGANVVIFPEGTRSLNGQMLPFKSGAFLLAIKAETPIIPIAIKGANIVWPAGKILMRPATVELRVGKPIPVADAKQNEREKLSLKVRETMEELQNKTY